MKWIIALISIIGMMYGFNHKEPTIIMIFAIVAGFVYFWIKEEKEAANNGRQ